MAGVERKYCGICRRYFEETEDKAVLRDLPVEGRIALDLGTGTGRFALLLGSRARYVIGVDLAMDRLVTARRLARRDQPIEFVVMDGLRLGLKDRSVDIVTAVGTFEFARELRPFLKEISRVLRPGGKAVFTCWNRDRWPAWDLLDRRSAGAVLWSATEIEQHAMDCGLRVTSWETVFYLPRKIFWVLYELLALEPLRRLYVRGNVRLDKWLAWSPRWRGCGRVIVARAVRYAEAA